MLSGYVHVGGSGGSFVHIVPFEPLLTLDKFYELFLRFNQGPQSSIFQSLSCCLCEEDVSSKFATPMGFPIEEWTIVFGDGSSALGNIPNIFLVELSQGGGPTYLPKISVSFA